VRLTACAVNRSSLKIKKNQKNQSSDGIGSDSGMRLAIYAIEH
jgi:hypothetical protein